MMNHSDVQDLCIYIGIQATASLKELAVSVIIPFLQATASLKELAVSVIPDT